MDSAIPVTQTRIILPRRRGDLFTRQRLLDILYDLLDVKLAIVAAPAGYGKTSLLIDFANHIEYPVCWYAIDSLDRDPLRFLAHFIAAIQIRFPAFGKKSMAALHSATQGELNIDHLATTIINDAFENISEHFVIVLDDYHLVDGSKPVDQFISRFVQDVDENCHVFIASRTLLSLPDFPLMVARAQVGGLSFEELAFQPEEIRGLFAQNYQIELTPEVCRAWIKQTEGWITGVLLSANPQHRASTKRRRVERVSGVGLNEYLEQIIDQQPQKVQDFMLRSSLLDEFDASLCQEVIGKGLRLEHQDWKGLMESVLRCNLFVLPVGEQGTWLRYHHLFQDFLQKKMARERPEETQQIRSQLAALYCQRRDWEKAYQVYHQMGERVAIARLVEQAGTSLMSAGRLEVLQTWLEALPPALMDARPMLHTLRGSLAVLQGNTRQGLNIFNQVVKDLRGGDEKYGLAQTLVRRSVAHRLAGDHAAALADAEETLALINSYPRSGHSQSEMQAIEAEALRAKGVSLYQQGKLGDALAWLTRSLEVYRSLQDNQYVSVLLMETGLSYQAMGDFSSAERNYAEALAHWRNTDNSLWQANVLNNLGFLQHLRGDFETATSTLEKALQHAQIVGVPRLQAFALSSIGDLYRDLRAIGEARLAYNQAFEIARQVEDRFLLIYLELATATLNRAEGDYIAARERIALAQQTANGNGSPYEQSLCAFEDGVLKLSMQQVEEALDRLQRALARFEADGHRIEAARTHLYLAIALHRLNKVKAAVQHLKRGLSSLQHLGKQQPLITTGWWEKENLQHMRSDPQLAVELAPFLRAVRHFEHGLPSLRRRLRQRVSIVPFAPPRLIIRALGRVQVKISDRLVTNADWQTQYARDLFFMVLAYPEGLTKEAIGAVFWPEISPEELKLRFKNTIYRVRRAVGKHTIILHDDYYHFNRNLDYEYDVEDFQKYLQLAEQSKEPGEKIAHYHAALRLYQGDFMPELDASWGLVERERLAKRYADALIAVAELHLAVGEFQPALAYCQQALDLDICDETAHRLAMQIHAAMGNRAAVARQFDRCRTALLEEIDAIPSVQTQSLFNSLMS